MTSVDKDAAGAVSGSEGSGGLRQAWVVGLFMAGPLLLTLNALFHPDVNSPAQAGQSVFSQTTAWYWVHVAGAVGAAAFSGIGVYLVRLGSAWRRKPMVAAGVMTLVGGWFFTVEQASHGLLMTAMVRGGESTDAAARAWKTFLDMSETTPVETGTMLFAFGLLVLAIDLLRKSPLPRWTGIALLAFIVLSMAADTSGGVWLVFGVLYTAPLAVIGVAASRLSFVAATERTVQ